ncbi:DEAD/DEAH box helicase [Sulfuriroseicoccus oceanibius]|uniref:DEAD/DEAH box helicase n=1 Tax=Sulfuriroseicoccus oceanibius TaxID=2707525 RepID=A0A6B3LDT6_9BACT|nr:DEAD/DEAH box helicase [Sulfuriroseicoccus oceanibius]QQL44457.1 DEAD/DEAH box helicase [Sulfuriroseicoccus oceanibius]
MELTTQWLGNVAGWKAMKQGKELVASVTAADWQDPVMRGSVRAGGRAMAAGFRVLGRDDVKNFCSCPEARSTGALCGHSVAVALAWIEQSVAPTPKPTAKKPKPAAVNNSQAKPLSDSEWATAVELSEAWVGKAAGAKNAGLKVVRGDASNANSSPVEQMVLNQWLEKIGAPRTSAMLSVPVAQVLELFTQLRAAQGSIPTGRGEGEVVFVGDHAVSLNGLEHRPQLTAEFSCDSDDPGDWEVSITVNNDANNCINKSESKSADVLLKGAGGVNCWRLSYSQSGRWSAVPVAGPGDGWSPIEQRELAGWLAAALDATVAPLTVSVEWLVGHLDDLRETFEMTALENELAQCVQLDDAPPVPVLEVEGSTNYLAGSVKFAYIPVNKGSSSEGVKSANLVAPDAKSSVVWSIDENGRAMMRQRRRDFEKAVLAEIESNGWILEADGSFKNKQPDAIFQFIAEKAPRWRENGWVVEFGERFTFVAGNVPVVRPQIAWQGSGEDWLMAEIDYKVVHQGREISLSSADVNNLLRSNRSHFKAGGQTVAVDLDSVREMHETLLDVDPRQSAAGRYQVDSVQADFLSAAVGSEPPQRLVEKPVNWSSIADLESFLRDYQKKGIEWMIRQAEAGRGILLGDDMGLGKTLQTLTFIDYWLKRGERREKKSAPALVVVPTSLLGNWQQEAAKWLPDRQVVTLHGPQRKKLFTGLDASDIVITSYGLVSRDLDSLYRDFEFSAVILDEASLLRNPRSQAAKAVRELQAKARVALSGTPVENSVRDLWSIFEFIQPGYLGGFKTFQDRYEKPLAGGAPDTSIGRRLARRVEPFFLRRTKSEVAPELPEKLVQVAYADLTAAQASLYRKLVNEARGKVKDLAKQGGGAGRMAMLTALLRLRQSCCDLRLLGLDEAALAKVSDADLSAKRELLREILRESIEGGHRVLVFSQFVQMLRLIEEDLQAEGWDYGYLDGQTQNRREVVDRFQKGKAPVFLISLKAGGYGLNLTAADTVVHFDPWWNPAVEAQATDRAHRIGQDRPVTVYKLITRGTIEEKVLRLQRRKQGVIDLAIDDRAPMMGGLDDKDLKELLG